MKARRAFGQPQPTQAARRGRSSSGVEYGTRSGATGCCRPARALRWNCDPAPRTGHRIFTVEAHMRSIQTWAIAALFFLVSAASMADKTATDAALELLETMDMDVLLAQTIEQS